MVIITEEVVRPSERAVADV